MHALAYNFIIIWQYFYTKYQWKPFFFYIIIISVIKLQSAAIELVFFLLFIYSFCCTKFNFCMGNMELYFSVSLFIQS